MGYAEHCEWLSGQGFDTSYAGNGTSPFHDYLETDPDEDCDNEEEETDGE